MKMHATGSILCAILCVVWAGCGQEQANIVASKEGGTQIYKIWMSKSVSREGTCSVTGTYDDNRTIPLTLKLFKVSKDGYELEGDLPNFLPISDEGLQAIPGKKSETAYTFDNTAIEQKNDPNRNLQQVNKVNLVFSPEEKGDWGSITGTYQQEFVETCSGNACPANLTNCKVSATFKGSALAGIGFISVP